jgi:hypothetical protein
MSPQEAQQDPRRGRSDLPGRRVGAGGTARRRTRSPHAWPPANPLVLAVMGGAVVFTGQLLPQLCFPLDFDYLHVTRYGDVTTGGEQLQWIVEPRTAVAGRTVLVLDDILDEGVTLAAIVSSGCWNRAPAKCFAPCSRTRTSVAAKPVSRRFCRRPSAEPLCLRLWHGRQGRLAKSAGGLCGKGPLSYPPRGRLSGGVCELRQTKNFPQSFLRGACNGKGFSGTMRFSKTKGEPNEQE